MAKPLIFWVEDNANDVMLLSQAFVDARISVDTTVADNAVLAFRYMQGREFGRELPRRPDLILVDINLPIFRGTVILEEMRNHAPWKGIPIVVLTSSSHERELQGCRARGAVECLTKPGTLDGYNEIVERLRKYLPRAGEPSTSAPADDVRPDDRPSTDRRSALSKTFIAR